METKTIVTVTQSNFWNLLVETLFVSVFGFLLEWKLSSVPYLNVVLGLAAGYALGWVFGGWMYLVWQRVAIFLAVTGGFVLTLHRLSCEGEMLVTLIALQMFLYWFGHWHRSSSVKEKIERVERSQTRHRRMKSQ